MKAINKILTLSMLAVVFVFGSTAGIISAATSPSIGAAVTYGILSNFYVNNVPGTTINGDIGFTTGPAIVPGGTHTNYGSGVPYANAGGDQATALAALNAQACTFTFASGSIDLSTDATHGPVGVYAPGVYCVLGNASIGGGRTVTLSGNGVYIFRMTGILTTTDNSAVTLSDGAEACNVWWTPSPGVVLTTLGSYSSFKGTIIDSTGIRVQTAVTWLGRALAFAGIVYTNIDDTITVPSMISCPTPYLLKIVKTVINDNGGTAVASDFNLHVKLSGVDVVGSPAVGVASPGRDYWLAQNTTYVVSEGENPGYTSTFSGDCDANGSVTTSSRTKTCTITNNREKANIVIIFNVILANPINIQICYFVILSIKYT